MPRLPKVGILAAGAQPHLDSDSESLRGRGLIAAETVQLITGSAGGDSNRLPRLARELVRAQADIIVAIGAVTARAVLVETKNIPVVYAVVVEPLGDGLVRDAQAAPLAGVTTFDPLLAGRQIRLLRSIIPSLSRIAVLADPAVSGALPDAIRSAASVERVSAQVVNLDAARLDETFELLQADRIDAIITPEQPATARYAVELANLARRHRLPLMTALDQSIHGALVSCGTSLRRAAGMTASFVDEFLASGSFASPGVQVFHAHEVTVNVETASALGREIPEEILRVASSAREAMNMQPIVW